MLWIMYHPERGNIKSSKFKVQSLKFKSKSKNLDFWEVNNGEDH